MPKKDDDKSASGANKQDAGGGTQQSDTGQEALNLSTQAIVPTAPPAPPHMDTTAIVHQGAGSRRPVPPLPSQEDPNLIQVAEDEEQALKFLQKRVGLSARMAKAAYSRHGEEEQKPMKTIWDASNAITAIARDIPHQDNRLDLERKAGQLLDTVAA